MTKERFKKAEFVAWIGIIGNLSLALLKGFIGWFANSKALLADALHTASDAASSFAVLSGLRAAKMPPDEDHPYGHEKAGAIASVIVSVLIFIVGVEIGISAIKSLYNGVDMPPKGYALIIVISIVLSEVLFQYKIRLGIKMSAHALITNARSHKYGVYSSLVALAGVGGAYLGKLFGLNYFYYLDPLASLIVSLLILRMGYQLLMNSIYCTSNHMVIKEDEDVLLQTVQRVNGVITVEDLRIKEHGHYVIVNVKISVNPRIMVMEGNEIAKDVKGRLMDRFLHISDVIIHVYPYDPGYPYKNNLEIEQNEFSSMLH